MFGAVQLDYFRVREKQQRQDVVNPRYDTLPIHKKNYTIEQKIKDINDRSKEVGPEDFIEINLGIINLTQGS